jgi:hypothetical protein
VSRLIALMLGPSAAQEVESQSVNSRSNESPTFCPSPSTRPPLLPDHLPTSTYFLIPNAMAAERRHVAETIAYASRRSSQLLL